MKELFEALLAALRRGETAALCTILGASGSAPRGAEDGAEPVSYTHLRAHETGRKLVCRLLLEKKKT